MPRKNVNETRINTIVDYLRSKTDSHPQVGMILGTGLGKMSEVIDVALEISYADIPEFPQSTVQGHKGKLFFGTLEGKPVMVFSGRFHYYEGYDMQDMTITVRIMKAMGVGMMIVSNAAGSVNPDYQAGDVVIIKDHINLFPDNPLRGVNANSFGLRFPDMLHAYDKGFIESTRLAAEKLGVKLHVGVYLGLQGPNLETPAEYNFFHQVGADLVGMSTIPEVIVAKHAEIPVLAFSLVSNVCYPPEAITETHIDDVISVVQNASEKMNRLIIEILRD